MQKSLLTLFLFATVAAAAQTGNDEGVDVYANIKEVGYVKAIQGGTITAGKEWEGTRIVKLKDGSCKLIERTELKFVKDGDAQRPEFKETKVTVACPQAATSTKP